jgi:hypoxanthine phosphoribosyltransferase
MDRCITIKDKQFRLYITRDKISEAVRNIAININEQLANEDPVFLVILNGSFIFAADLLRELSIPCEVSFIKVSSYSGTESTGMVNELIGLTENLNGRTVVIVEDIVDSGETLEKLVSILQKMNVKQVKVATALFKPGSYRKNVKVDYCALNIGNDFVVGYGMDYNGQGRNLKDIHVLAI